MAQFKDALVTGDARVLGTFYADIPTNNLIPFITKTYTDIIGDSSSNAQANNGFLFGSIKPDSYTTTWEVRYKVRVWVPSNTNYEAFSEVLLTGVQGSINSYAIFNHFYNTSYRPVYYHQVYRLKQAGFTAGYGHALGISLSDSTNRADTSLKRSFTVDILSQKNCTVTLNDTAVKYASWSGTGTTNYNDVSTYNFASNGLQETSDNDDTCQLRSYYDRPLVDTNKLYGYSICTLTSDDKLTGFVTSYSTGTTKTKNSATFKINAPIWYYATSTEKAAGSYTGDNTLCNQYSLIDLRYSTNCGTTLTANKPVYLVGIPNGITYTLADTWWTQTLPSSADGKIYIYLGIALDTYRISWQIEHPIYWYKDGAVKLYIPSAGDLAYINKGSGSSKYLREDGTWQTVSSGSGTVTGVTAGAGLNTTSSDTATDGGTISSSGTLYLTKSGVTAGTYQGLTVDKYGRVTSASNQGYVTTDTKNTAGSTNSASTLYLIGATSQAANPQTYSNSKLYYNNGLQAGASGAGGAQTTDITQNSTTLTIRADEDSIGYSKIQTKSSDIDIYGQKEDQSKKAEIALSGKNGTIQVSATAGVTIQDVVAPTNNSDAANKKYVDDTVATAPDTKNTAGTTNSTSKIYLAGATEQSANPQTYSNVNCYASGGKLYSNAKEVVNLSDSQALTNKTYNGYTLAGASAKAVDTSISKGSTSTNLPTSAAVANYAPPKQNTGTNGNSTITNKIDIEKADAYDGISIYTEGKVDANTYSENRLDMMAQDAQTSDLTLGSYIKKGSATKSATISTFVNDNGTTLDNSEIRLGADDIYAVGNITINDGQPQNTVTINGVVTPTSNTMAANKKYVDDNIPTTTSQLTNNGEDGAHTYLANYSDDMVGVGVNDNGEFYWLEGGSPQTEHSLLPFHYLDPTPTSSNPFIVEDNPTGMYFIKPVIADNGYYMYFKLNSSCTGYRYISTASMVIVNNHPVTDGDVIGYVEYFSGGYARKYAMYKDSTQSSGIATTGVGYNLGLATVATSGSYNDLTDKPSVGEVHSGTGDPAADLGNDGDLYVKLG